MRRAPWAGSSVAAIAAAALVLVGVVGVAGGALPVGLVDHPALLAQAGSTSTVYVLGSTCNTSPCLHLFRTTDDGAKLVKVTAPPVSSWTLRQLVFANPRDGIALEGQVGSTILSATFYATYNGGTTWVKESAGTGLSVLAAAATSSEYDVVTAHCPHPNSACAGVRLQRSKVGAIAWTSTSLANQSGLGTFGVRVAAFAKSVWLSEATPKGAPELASSRNGGASFTLHAAPHLAAVTPCELWASSRTTLWAQCTTGTLVGFAHSDDAGSSWTYAKVGPIGNTSGGAFDPVSTSTAYLARGTTSDELYRVTGPTGVAAARGKIPYSDLYSLVFTNMLSGMVVGTTASSSPPRLSRTTSAGASWKPVTLPL